MPKKKLTPEDIFDKLDELHQEEQDLLEQLKIKYVNVMTWMMI